MPKIEKTFPSPYGGMSEQSVELMLDQQCTDMVNCVPDLVLGTQRRNGTQYICKQDLGLADKCFHFYDRGEGDERYFMYLQDSTVAPIRIFDILGNEKTVTFANSVTTASYLGTDASKLKAITVQDRTFLVNKSKVITQSVVDTPYFLYDRAAYYWLSRSSNDVNNQYNYAVYLDGVAYQFTSNKSDLAATGLAHLISSTATGFTATAKGSMIKITKTGFYSVGQDGRGGIRVPYSDTHKYIAMRANATAPIEYVDMTLGDTTITPIEETHQYKILVQGYQIETIVGGVTDYRTYATLEPLGWASFKYYMKQGSNYINPQIRVLDILVSDNGTFTFDYWDSWGSQASIGWQGSITKLSDLPRAMPFSNVYVNITGDDDSQFTDYYVTHDGSTWVETLNPMDNRADLNNMPIRIDRLSDGTFEVATLTWERPKIGSTVTNPTPSFVNKSLNDIFFYKNRLGFASGGNIILSETGGYYNFYSKTVLEIIDDDPIDIAIPSSDATNIYYAVAFQSGLFVFTKDTQYILKHTDTFSPLTVAFDLISKTPMDTNVEPINASNSLFFISKVGTSSSQLREYKYSNDTLVADGIDLSVQTPSLLPNISKLIVDITLGYVIMTSDTTPSVVYCYKYLQQGSERVQSAFFKFSFNFNIINIFSNRSRVLISRKDLVNSYILSLDLLLNKSNKEDTIDDTITKHQYISYFTLPRWNIKITKVETPIDNLIVKRVKFIGEGTYDVSIYRKDYGTTTIRTYGSNSTVDGSASILGKNKNVVITLQSHNNKPFRLDSMILEGMYTQTSREVN